MFASGVKPTGTYKQEDISVARLDLKPDHSYSLDVIMAEHPFAGRWTFENGELRLVDGETGSVPPVLKFAGQDCLVDASAKLLPGQSAKFWKMSEAWEKDLQSADRQQGVVRTAEKVALGVTTYATDHGDILPRSQAEFEAALKPYVAQNGVLGTFVYTFKGGKLPPEKERSTVILGYILGNGGRAVAYLDGSAVWKAD
jgi:hypothetical protein